MPKKIDYSGEILGKKFKNNLNQDFIVTDVFRENKQTRILCKFGDGTEVDVRQTEFQKGSVENPCAPALYGIGFMGQGKYGSQTHPRIHQTYLDMFKRCYSEKRQERQKTYIGCEVSTVWHNFQLFAEWYETNYKQGYQLDKDYLSPGNRVYSPETCVFIPKDLNTFLTFNQRFDEKKVKLPGITFNESKNAYIVQVKTLDKRV